MATLQEPAYKTKHDTSVNGCVVKMAEHKPLVTVILLLSKKSGYQTHKKSEFCCQPNHVPYTNGTILKGIHCCI